MVMQSKVVKGWKRLSVAIAVLLVAHAGAALAGSETPEPADSRLLTGTFPPDPEGVWRTIKADSSTSTCIGELVSPLCAVETVLACFERLDIELCRIGFPEEMVDWEFHVPRVPSSYASYRIVRTRLAGPEDIECQPKRCFDRELGDLLIDLIDRPCWSDDGVCYTPDVPKTYTTRRVGELWKVFDVYTPPY